MDRIKVNIDLLESSVLYYSYAAKFAGDMNYRLKLLGTEISEDMELAQSPEYAAVMLTYEEAKNAVEKVNRFFEETINTILQLPELYSETERSSVRRIENLEKRIKEFRPAVLDLTAVDKLVKKAFENELSSDEVKAAVEKSYLELQSPVVSANSQQEDEMFAVQPESVKEKVDDSFFSTAKAVSDITAKSESMKRRGE